MQLKVYLTSPPKVFAVQSHNLLSQIRKFIVGIWGVWHLVRPLKFQQ